MTQIRLPLSHWNAHCHFTFVLREAWAGLEEILSVRSIHSLKHFQHFKQSAVNARRQ